MHTVLTWLVVSAVEKVDIIYVYRRARFSNRPTTSAYEVHIYLSVHMTFRDFIDANKDAKLIHGFLVVKLKSLRRRFNGCNHYFVMGVYIVVCF